MTSYHISIGYNPCPKGSYDDMWRVLKSEARAVCDAPREIEAEARRLGCPETCERGCCQLTGYAESYAKPFDGENPVKVVEPQGEERGELVQMASTDAGFKYHVRRAFVRLLMERMHRKAIEVSVVVG